MNRRSLPFFAAFILLFTVSCKPKATRDGATELRIAVEQLPSYAPLLVAKQKQWLDKTLSEIGVKVEWSTFVPAPAHNETTYLTNNDVVLTSDAPAIRARAAGVNYVTVGVAATGPKALALVARADAAVKSAADLKGKKVGVSLGTDGHHLLSLALARSGLKLEDVKVVDLSPKELVTAFNKGDVVAAATSEPFVGQLEEKGAVRVADGTGLKQGAFIIAANDAYAQTNTDIIEAILRAYQQGAAFIKEHPQEAASLVAKELDWKPSQVEKLLSLYTFDPVIRAEHIADLKATEDFLRTAGVYKVNVDAFTDSRYLYRLARK
jgi:sulfonate transport system substrate-binding protein